MLNMENFLVHLALTNLSNFSWHQPSRRDKAELTKYGDHTHEKFLAFALQLPEFLLCEDQRKEYRAPQVEKQQLQSLNVLNDF